MIVDLNQDISDLMGIYKYSLDQITEKQQQDICQCILESVHNGDEFCQVNIGFGSIIFYVDDEGIEYKFIPSQKFEDMLTSTIQSDESPLKIQIENQITKRMLKIYKELF